MTNQTPVSLSVSPPVASPVNLLGLDRQGLEAFFTAHGEQRFRATQVLKWIHQIGVTDFEQMTNLSKALRERLATISVVEPPKVAHHQTSVDGTNKWLIELDDGNHVETVFIPDGRRGTLCVSSQVGCTLNCRFCSTGTQGFNRNLTVAEVIGQVWAAYRTLGYQHGGDRVITNVVMMGMGEPLLNFDNVISAMNMMLDDNAYGLAWKRVTLSTAGVVPELMRLNEHSPVALAVSLHAPNDELRSQLVPLNRKYPLAELMRACRNYADSTHKRSITFEYVMLDGINDSPQHARQLARLLRDLPAKVNLIPFNPFPGTDYQCSSAAAISGFHKLLNDSGIICTTRRTRGDDIDAACGQLVGEFKDRSRRRVRFEAGLRP